MVCSVYGMRIAESLRQAENENPAARAGFLSEC
jgi:hypothetical protein